MYYELYATGIIKVKLGVKCQKVLDFLSLLLFVITVLKCHKCHH